MNYVLRSPKGRRRPGECVHDVDDLADRYSGPQLREHFVDKRRRTLRVTALPYHVSRLHQNHPEDLRVLGETAEADGRLDVGERPGCVASSQPDQRSRDIASCGDIVW